MVWCSSCAKQVPGLRPYDGSLSCNLCGRILENFNFSTEVTFVKNAAGQSQLQGTIVRSRQSEISVSRERTLRKSREDIMNMRDGLGIGDERDDVVDMANRLYAIAVERNFTRGRKAEQVQASCLYFTCREKNIPFLLIDFSSYLSINVYELGAVYLQLCEMLYVADNRNFEKLLDPSIFIPKFTNSLLHGGNKEVVKTARDIIASMKRDWMQTGRKPSGICGAALYISALSHGLKCSKTDIVKVVHICEATLTKRLVEFENTESASLTVDELTEKEREFHKKSLFRQIKPKESVIKGVLCRHQNCKPVAYGLCESCYDDFMTVSGGIVGGSDPPAFQSAVKERMAKTSGKENADEDVSGIPSPTDDNSERPNPEREADSPTASKYEKLHSFDPAGTKFSEDSKQATADEPGDCEANAVDDNAEVSDESDNFSDIDDVEVDGYIHNEEEKHLKKIIWEEMNREYLEEQAAKEAALAAAEALKANNGNCPEAARKLAEATRAALAKSRKEKQQKKAAEAKNSVPPKSAVEAASQMLSKKRMSSKINMDALEKLFDASVASDSPKKRKAESKMESDDENYKFQNKKQEADERYEEDDEYRCQGVADEECDIEPDYENMEDDGYVYEAF